MLREGLRRLRAEIGIPAGFSAGVLREADEAASSPALPGRDLTDVAFVTLDPPGSTDLDQAFHLSREAGGYRLRYAIADVAAFVRPGGALDIETHRRGMTFYAPSRRTPLHPEVLSESSASLLPGVDRPALVWDLRFDSDGVLSATDLGRAMVRSRAQWDYPRVQAELDSGTADEQAVMLRELGALRRDQEAGRGGVSLAVPEQEVSAGEQGWQLSYRRSLPVEEWNAQLSLATGMAAADLMLTAGKGMLRTLPPARDSSLARLRKVAAALGIGWPHRVGYADFVRGLDPSVPRQAAMLNACTSLFRGAGYEVFDGTPTLALHAAIAAPYAHVTAPLRRLGDRYAGELCLAVVEDREPPEWVNEGLESLPGELAEASRRSGRYERGIVDLVEAMVLSPRLGEVFTGTIIDADPADGDGVLQLPEPAVQAKVVGDVVLGEEADATLVSADLLSGQVRFAVLATTP